MDVKHRLLFLSSAFTCVVTGFLIVMHFRHDPHWPAGRLGGTPGAVALIPVCLISYGVGCFYVNRWLHPKVFPGLRAAIPRPAHDAAATPGKPLRTILSSGLVSLVSGAILLIHFSQPSGTDVRWGVNLGALLCIPIFVVSMGFCVYAVDRWLRACHSASSTTLD